MEVNVEVAFQGVDACDDCRPIIDDLLNRVCKGDFMGFRLAINEAIVNVFTHGKEKYDTKGTVSIRYKKRYLCISVWGESNGFDVAAHLERLKEMEDDWQERLKSEVHGRGIWMMLLGCDRVIFNKDGTKVSLLVKVDNFQRRAGLLNKVRIATC